MNPVNNRRPMHIALSSLGLILCASLTLILYYLPSTPNLGDCYANTSVTIRPYSNVFKIIDTQKFGVTMLDLGPSGWRGNQIHYILYSDLYMNYVERDCIDEQ